MTRPFALFAYFRLVRLFSPCSPICARWGSHSGRRCALEILVRPVSKVDAPRVVLKQGLPAAPVCRVGKERHPLAGAEVAYEHIAGVQHDRDRVRAVSRGREHPSVDAAADQEAPTLLQGQNPCGGVAHGRKVAASPLAICAVRIVRVMCALSRRVAAANVEHISYTFLPTGQTRAERQH